MKEVTAHPLCWPGGWRRTKPEDRTASRFCRMGYDAGNSWKSRKKLTVAGARDELMDELRHAADDDNSIVVSTNIPVRGDGLPRGGSVGVKREDPGVAVYFRQNGRDIAMACDKFDDIPDNLYAIAKTLEAMRGIKRLRASEASLRLAREALRGLCDALERTHVYSGVQYGKAGLARAINDARAALKAIGEGE